MRAVVSRHADTSQTDGWGQTKPDANGFAEVGTVPCWAWSKSTRRAIDTGGKSAVVEDMRAMLPRYIDNEDGNAQREPTDIEVGDQLEITDRLGVVQFAGPVAVESISFEPGSHLELMLKRHA